MTARAAAEAQAASRAVIVMAKRPAPGRTKTRLMPALSPESAAAFYECLLLDTIDRIRARDDATLVIAVDEPESVDWFTAVAPDAQQVLQQGQMLGERLDAVMSECLNRFDAVFAINSDSPDVPDTHLTDAFVALDHPDTDVVLAPTVDGGYWLIGWKQRWAPMVREVIMSTPTVAEDTLAIAKRLGARAVIAPTWHDVDDPEDLARLRTAIDGGLAPRTAGFLSDHPV